MDKIRQMSAETESGTMMMLTSDEAVVVSTSEEAALLSSRTVVNERTEHYSVGARCWFFRTKDQMLEEGIIVDINGCDCNAVVKVKVNLV